MLHRGLAVLAAWVPLIVLPGISEANDVSDRIRPFAKKYCDRCHNSKEARGELDLTAYATARDITADFRQWNHIVEFIRGGEMPPENASQPTLEERTAVVDTIENILLTEARKYAGDPGVILPRRLSNTEYDLSIRDLTGVDIRPTRDFPADPAAGEGFDNTGEALTMSPSLLRKYLGAAQDVANHLLLNTDGVSFAPHPVTSYNERKKLTEQAIIDFYQSHEVKLRDYLEAAWRFHFRFDTGRRTTVERFAEQRRLSGRYLSLVYQTLTEASSDSVGPLRQIGQQWKSLPAPTDDKSQPRELIELEQRVESARRLLCYRQEQLIKSNAGNWPIGHLDFRARIAARRDQFNPDGFEAELLLRPDRPRVPKDSDKDPAKDNTTLFIRIEPALEEAAGNYVVLHRPLFSKSGNRPKNEKDEQKNEVVTLREFLQQHAPALARQLKFGRHPKGRDVDADSIVVQAPALIEIPLDEDLRRHINNRHLLTQCELDPEHSREGAVLVQQFSGKSLDDASRTQPELLMYGDSQLAGKLAASGERFCNAFPNRFFYVDNRRGLAAGFHLVEGFFRDDQPLVEKVLSDAERQELDQLWEELHFVTNSAEVLIRGFVWFERSERHVLHDERFDFLRSEDPQLVEDELLTKFERIYYDRLNVKLDEEAETVTPRNPDDEKFRIIHRFFNQIRSGLARRRELLKLAEQVALQDLEDIARRAYRRMLNPQDVVSLRNLYSKLRSQGQGIEEACRGVVTAILMSPDFCYHFTDVPSGRNVTPIADSALASRLSYFLWSSIPDDELIQLGWQRRLRDQQTLLAQTRRMLKSPRIEAFSREFLGQWLRYRDYLDKDPINAGTFPGYTEELREAMFEEPVRLATWLIREDRPVTELLTSDVTFVNGVLASHYGRDISDRYRTEVAQWTTKQRQRGVSQSTQPDALWHRVSGLREAGRGGLFGMGVVLTKNSAGERTSPVKRGFWTVHHLLGQHFPPPPADVPELPPGEKEATKTIRELMAEHTVNPNCAICHVHFDGVGLALEGFDPIGRARTKDLGGRQIDNVAELPNGTTAEGIPGLIDYIDEHRRKDFIRTLCRKFLGYALGRSVLLSDQPLLAEMESALEKNDYRFSVLFETVVTSPQFRNQRGRDYSVTTR